MSTHFSYVNFRGGGNFDCHRLISVFIFQIIVIIIIIIITIIITIITIITTIITINNNLIYK